MDRELIECCAKLCGWIRHGATFLRDDLVRMAWVGEDGVDLDDVGLRDVEDALLHRGWYLEVVGDEGGTPCYLWAKRIGHLWAKRMGRQYVLHLDRATAAALAAKAVVVEEGK